MLCVTHVSRVLNSDEDGVGDVRHNLPRFARPESPAPIVIFDRVLEISINLKKILHKKSCQICVLAKNQRRVGLFVIGCAILLTVYASASGTGLYVRANLYRLR